MEQKQPSRANNMTTGKEWKRIVLFALPIFLGQLLQQLYSTVDGIIVGNCVSTAALAAVGSCSVMLLIFISVSTGMSNGGSTAVAQFFGAKETERMRAAAATILRMMLVLGLAFSLFGILFARFCVSVLLSVKESDVAGEAVTYLRIYSVGMLFTFLYNADAAILRAVGDSRALLRFLLISTVVNVVLDLLFVAVFPWGIAGAAWATVISQAVCFGVSLGYVYRNYPEFRFSAAELVHRDPVMFGICLRMGIPVTVQMLVVSCGQLVMQRLVNSFGTDTMAACTVGTRFDHYCCTPVFGLQHAMAAFTGQNVGANRYDRVKRGLRGCVLMSIGAVVVICCAMYGLAPFLAGLFGVEGVARQQAVEYMRYLAIAYPLFAAFIPVNGVLQGGGDPLPVAVSSLVALFFRVAGAYFMADFVHWGYSSCWVSYPVGWIFALAVTYYFYFSGHWKKKSLVKDPAA